MRSFSAARVPLKVWATIIFFGLTTIAAAGYLPLLHAGMGTSGGGPPATTALIQLGGLGYITQLDGSLILWTP